MFLIIEASGFLWLELWVWNMIRTHTIRNSKPFTVFYGINKQKKSKPPLPFADYDWTDLLGKKVLMEDKSMLIYKYFGTRCATLTSDEPLIIKPQLRWAQQQMWMWTPLLKEKAMLCPQKILIFKGFDHLNFMQQSQTWMCLDFSKVFDTSLDQLLF